MSAICGILHFDDRPVDQSSIESMVEASRCRGPDGAAYRVSENAGFAHLAFNLTPESDRETQPLVSSDGRFILLADVRLDNREELAEKLDVDSEHLAQVSDPYLLMRAWQAWGTSYAEKLLGDFVFAVWDRLEECLFLARDALGSYGLAYRQDGDRFVFSSEIAAILDLPGINPQINRDAVLKNLAGLQLTQKETFFESVYQLPPAHCLLVSATESRMWKYWEIDPGHRISYHDEREYTDHFLELLTRAVSTRMRARGPFGISLSGGADSTLLAALAQQNLSQKPEQGNLGSFSYVFDRYYTTNHVLVA